MTSLKRRKLLCFLLGHPWHKWAKHIRVCPRCFKAQHQHLHIARNGVVTRKWVDDLHLTGPA